MRTSRLIYSLILVFLIGGCARVYYSPDAYQRAYEHRIIAIAPPKVYITPRKGVDQQDLVRQQVVEANAFQQEMYSWMLARKMQGNMFIEIQDVETTNARLRQAGYFDDQAMTPSDICRTLDVDGVLMSTFSLSRPMSEGAAIATGILFGLWGPTKDATAALEIHDLKTEKLIWHYNHNISGSLGSTHARLVDDLLRNASRKMPYFR